MTNISALVQQALDLWAVEEDPTPFSAWAGCCSEFLEKVIEFAEFAAVPYSIGNAHGGKVEGNFVLALPPGLSDVEINRCKIFESLDHIWIVSDGRHYDGAHPAGVDSPFELRLFRQVAVEMLRRHSPAFLNQLSIDYQYWRESEKLFDDYLSVLCQNQLAKSERS